MRIVCTLSAVGKLAFWLLLIGLVLGLGIGHEASSADVGPAAAAARTAGSAAWQPDLEGRWTPCRRTQ
jgi:hypothetical protein